jgi:hypothetical protein
VPGGHLTSAFTFWAAVESKRGEGHSVRKASKLVAKDLDKHGAIEEVPWETIRRLHRAIERCRKRDSGCEKITAELLSWLKTPSDTLELMRIRRKDGSRVPIMQRNQHGVILPVLTKDWRHWLSQK